MKVRRRVSPVQSKELQADARRQLLERRPDILQAEQLLRSANAQVGESLAESFPKIGLTALLGKVSPELSGFTLGSANAWGIAAEGSGPLFEGGRLVGQYKQSKAARNEFELRSSTDRLECLSRGIRRISVAKAARRGPSTSGSPGKRAGICGKAFDQTVCGRQSGLLRSFGSSTAAFPGGTKFGAHATRPTRCPGHPLQNSRGRLAG